MCRLEDRAQQIWDAHERYKELRTLTNRRRNSDVDPLLVEEMRQLEIDLADHVYNYQVQEEEEFEPVSETVTADLGMISTLAQLLVRVRDEMEKELTRDDLTPYMYSILLRRRDSVNDVLGLLGGRRARGTPLEKVPTYLVYAEYDDGSIDVQEAYGRDEALKIGGELVEEGAVVYTYQVLSEYGYEYPVFEPVRPIENRQRPISRNKYERLVRLKGGEKFRLPEEIKDVVIADFRWGQDDDEEP